MSTVSLCSKPSRSAINPVILHSSDLTIEPSTSTRQSDSLPFTQPLNSLHCNRQIRRSPGIELAKRRLEEAVKSKQTSSKDKSYTSACNHTSGYCQIPSVKQLVEKLERTLHQQEAAPHQQNIAHPSPLAKHCSTSVAEQKLSTETLTHCSSLVRRIILEFEKDQIRATETEQLNEKRAPEKSSTRRSEKIRRPDREAFERIVLVYDTFAVDISGATTLPVFQVSQYTTPFVGANLTKKDHLCTVPDMSMSQRDRTMSGSSVLSQSANSSQATPKRGTTRKTFRFSDTPTPQVKSSEVNAQGEIGSKRRDGSVVQSSRSQPNTSPDTTQASDNAQPSNAVPSPSDTQASASPQAANNTQASDNAQPPEDAQSPEQEQARTDNNKPAEVIAARRAFSIARVPTTRMTMNDQPATVTANSVATRTPSIATVGSSRCKSSVKDTASVAPEIVSAPTTDNAQLPQDGQPSVQDNAGSDSEMPEESISATRSVSVVRVPTTRTTMNDQPTMMVVDNPATRTASIATVGSLRHQPSAMDAAPKMVPAPTADSTELPEDLKPMEQEQAKSGDRIPEEEFIPAPRTFSTVRTPTTRTTMNNQPTVVIVDKTAPRAPSIATVESLRRSPLVVATTPVAHDILPAPTPDLDIPGSFIDESDTESREETPQVSRRATVVQPSPTEETEPQPDPSNQTTSQPEVVASREPSVVAIIPVLPPVESKPTLLTPYRSGAESPGMPAAPSPSPIIENMALFRSMASSPTVPSTSDMLVLSPIIDDRMLNYSPEAVSPTEVDKPFVARDIEQTIQTPRVATPTILSPVEEASEKSPELPPIRTFERPSISSTMTTRTPRFSQDVPKPPEPAIRKPTINRSESLEVGVSDDSDTKTNNVDTRDTQEPLAQLEKIQESPPQTKGLQEVPPQTQELPETPIQPQAVQRLPTQIQEVRKPSIQMPKAPLPSEGSRRQKAVGKARRLVLKKPVLSVMLGREIAGQTYPLLHPEKSGMIQLG